MNKKIVLSSTSKRKLYQLLDYLENEWSVKVKKDFIKKLDKNLLKISKYPSSNPESKEIKGLFKSIVTKQISLFYKVKSDEIEIVTLFDTRQNPNKLK